MSRKSYWSKVPMLAVVLLIISSSVYSQTVQPYIRVDQFGYRPGDPKTAVIADPQVGYNASDEFTPGSVYQIRSADDNSVVFEGAPVVWNNGNTCTQSGDRGWWFSFSEVSEVGYYYVYDVEKNVRSYNFEIRPDIYKDMLRAATKMFYYQRLGIEKDARYVGEKWADGYQQPMDSVCRDIFDKDNPDKIRDMRGGWMDAGDQNKYTTFTVQPVHHLLNAYTQNPEVFTDDFDIPESGNGIPDILDEVKWQLDWLKRMQDTIDGGAYIKMGGEVTFPLSQDTKPKYYFSPKSTAATIVISSMMAHAYLVYREFPEFYDYAQDCKRRAVLAWEFFQSTPMNFDIDDGSLGGGRANRDRNVQEAEALVAAIYLFAATGEQQYHEYILSKYRTPANWGVYDTHRPKALLYYAFLPNADSDLSMRIISQKIDSYNNNAGGWTQFDETKDLYRSYMPDNQYHWGSNQPKANVGNTLTHFLNYYLMPEKRAEIESHALNFLHYFHGVNPVGITYLTNMEEFGADSSAKYAWHKWFNPHHCPPGYIPGGPNKFYKVDPTYPGEFSPPQNQPHQKSFRDWVEDWRTYPWEVTEPAIYYQAAYVYLVSNFAKEETQQAASIDSLKIFHQESDSLYENIKQALYLRKYPLAAWNASVSWHSSDTSIAIVDGNGEVTPLRVGSVQIKVIAENGVSDSVMVHIKECSSAPFHEVPHEIPGIIESEEFDVGCNTYFDTDAINSGRQLRPDEGVDIEITKDDRSVYNVGWIHAGEWLRYSVTVAQTDTYIIECRVATIKPSQMMIEFSDESKLDSPLQLPQSGGYQNWFSHYTKPIDLTEGEKAMTVTFLSDGFNINHLVFHKYVPVTGVEITVDSLHLLVDSVGVLTANVLGDDGVVSDVVWSSSDNTIATVDGQGLVKGVSSGMANVMATSVVDGLSDSVVVFVTPNTQTPDTIPPTIVPEYSSPSFTIYPNPVPEGSFNIKCMNTSNSIIVHIYNLRGEIVYNENLHITSKQTSSVHPNLYPGLYLVKIFSEKGNYVEKLHIQ